MAFVLRSASVSAPKATFSRANARSVVVRAAEEPQGPSSSVPSTEAPSTSAPVDADPATQYARTASPPTPFGASLADVMNFGGSAPEITNGRLAMLGFVAALGAELSSGESVIRQLGDEPTLINMTFLLFIGASLIPAFQGKKPEAFGPLTPNAELINGRAAMIGFAALLAIEATQGSALF